MVVSAILLQAVAGCAFQRIQVWYEFSVDGPVRIMEGVGYQVATGDDGFLFHTRDDSPITLSLRQVQEYQLVTITIDVRRRSAGFYSSSFNPNEGEIIARALWVLSEPYRSNFRLVVNPGMNPAELRLQIDRDDDGSFDAELPPQIAVTGKIDHLAYLLWDVNPAADVEPATSDQVSITLDYPRDIQSHYAGPLQAIVYTIYPDQPELQTYEGPFTVDTGNTVRYRVLFTDGYMGAAPEIPVR